MNRIPFLAAIALICLLFTQCKKADNGPVNNYNDPIRYEKDSITVCLPTAFTPNYDGKNDVFRPIANSSSFTDYKLTVFKDNGATVFQTTDIHQSWNGTDGNGHAYTDYHYTVHLHFTINGDTYDAYSYLYLLSSGNGCVHGHSSDALGYIFEDQFDPGTGQPAYPTGENFCP